MKRNPGLVWFSLVQLSSAQLSGDLNEAARDRELDEN